MSLNPILQQRLYSQKLAGIGLFTAEEVVGWLGVVQAQDYSGGKWSVGLRAPGLFDVDVERAVTSRRILRTWALRGTLHFVRVQDIRWMLRLLAPRLIASNARRYRELELDEETMGRASDLMAKALETGQELLRSQLLAHLQQQGISTQGQRAAYFLQRAALDERVCQVGVRRNTPVYLSLDVAAPESPVLAREEALAELARRYFTSHGPATVQDFAAWSGLLIREARAGLEAIKSGLVEEIIQGKSYLRSLRSPAVAEPLPEPGRVPMAHLLPSYDEYLLAYNDRSAMLDPALSRSINPNNGMSSTFALDGRIAGTWKRTLQRGKVFVNWIPFWPLAEAEKEALSAAIARYAAFINLPLG